jgi:hypothetical protein
MTTAVLHPDDEPEEAGTGEAADVPIEDTLDRYRQFLQIREGTTYSDLARAWNRPLGTDQLSSWLRSFQVRAEPTSWWGGDQDFGNQAVIGQQEKVVDDALLRMRRNLLSDKSGRRLPPSESLEKQRELLSTIAQELVGQREDARRGEADALARERRSDRRAAWSLVVTVLALLVPIVQMMLKLLGMDV